VFVAAQLKKAPAPPLGVVAAIASGFETVNARLELILLPLALDLFLWLGPRLSVKPVLDRWLALAFSILSTPPGADPEAAQNLETVRQELTALVTRTGSQLNLFSALSTAPLGLPSLLAARQPVSAPNGAPAFWNVYNGLEYFLLFVVFTLLGLFLGALYFGGIAQQVREARLNWGRLFQQVWGDWARLTALLALALVGMGIVSVPVGILAIFMALISPLLGSFVIATAALWLVVYFGFTLPGIVLQRRGLFRAAWDSLRIAHVSLPQTVTLYTAILLLYLGLGLVWNLPADDSWLLLIGVGGHALVSTALVSATFVFYQDRYRWWAELRQTRRARSPAR
jgi:hypothetical protein